MTSIYRVYNVWLYDIFIGVLHYKVIICWLRQLWIRNYIQSLDYTYLCPWGNHEKRSGALKFGPYRLKGTGSHQHQAKSSVTQTYTVDLERADCFGRINFRVVDTKPNPGETPIFRSSLVPSVADSFRKCIGDKSATLNLKPHQTWKNTWMVLKGTWRIWMVSGTLTWFCDHLAVWKLRSATPAAKLSIFTTQDFWLLHLRRFFSGFGLDFAIFSFSFSCLFLQATATWKERSSSASEWSLGFSLKTRFTPPTLHWACHCCSPWFHFTPAYGTFGSNTGSADKVLTAFTWRCRPCSSRSRLASASAAAFSVK